MEEGYEFMNILSIEEARNFLPQGQEHPYRKQKVVVITGVTGQDGSFMVDYLLQHTDYVIFGGARRLSVYNHSNVDHLKDEPRFHLINFDLTDAHSISSIVARLRPDYFINFAAQSFVKSSWDFPAQTWETNTTGVLNILEAIRQSAPLCRFYNAGSSEEFGNIVQTPQDETHPLRPRSPYGASKAAARQLVKVYRESYGLYALQGWLFNHEGVRRGEEFVTRKITKKVAEIFNSLHDGTPVVPLELGNIDANRDWSDAEDMVDAVWKMMNQDEIRPEINKLPKGGILILPPEEHTRCHEDVVKLLKEYVVASGESHTVREFVEESFRYVGINGTWVGEKEGEVFMTDPADPKCIVKINPSFYRPAEVETLQGDPSLIKKELGWSPKTSFKGLVEKMVKRDMK
jgi:GDPmannose 4,6-dehydratase